MNASACTCLVWDSTKERSDCRAFPARPSLNAMSEGMREQKNLAIVIQPAGCLPANVLL